MSKYKVGDKARLLPGAVHFTGRDFYEYWEGDYQPGDVVVVVDDEKDSDGDIRVHLVDDPEGIMYIRPKWLEPFVDDPVNHPSHYTRVGGMEVIDILEAFFPDDQLLWQVGKYILRAGHKGAKVEDMEKGAWYLNRAIEKEQQKENNE